MGDLVTPRSTRDDLPAKDFADFIVTKFIVS
jgi:hypothetical protein